MKHIIKKALRDYIRITNDSHRILSINEKHFIKVINSIKNNFSSYEFTVYSDVIRVDVIYNDHLYIIETLEDNACSIGWISKNKDLCMRECNINNNDIILLIKDINEKDDKE